MFRQCEATSAHDVLEHFVSNAVAMETRSNYKKAKFQGVLRQDHVQYERTRFPAALFYRFLKLESIYYVFLTMNLLINNDWCIILQLHIFQISTNFCKFNFSNNYVSLISEWINGIFSGNSCRTSVKTSYNLNSINFWSNRVFQWKNQRKFLCKSFWHPNYYPMFSEGKATAE